jgi:hypothetical protein
MSEHDDLLFELRRLARTVDPVPDEVTAYAESALGWRRVDAELAELLADSRLEADALARSAEGAARQLSFRATALELDLEIQDAEDGAVILGQLAPADSAQVEVQRDDGTLIATGATDELGRLRVEVGEHGRVRLVVRRAGATPVETSWFDV